MLKLSEFFEVEEGVEFKVDSCTSLYKIVNNELLYTNNGCYWERSLNGANWFIGKEIKIIPPKKTISEDEKVILRNLPSKYTWIARDKNGTLMVYAVKPDRAEFEFGHEVEFNNYDKMTLFEHLFQCIKWEDEEPTKIYDLLKEVL